LGRRRTVAGRLAALGLGLALLVGHGAPAAAQTPPPGAWLASATPTNWNVAGATLPLAPAPAFDAATQCAAGERPAESPEEEQVVAAGWRLFNAARAGWGLRAVDALAGYDGMCRPVSFNTFVFADGRYAGTTSPTAMSSRADGVGRLLDLRGTTLTAQFVRYTATDPLCCPSSTYQVLYAIDRSGDAPLLVPRSATRTSPG
jgi:hypothetical protein